MNDFENVGGLDRDSRQLANLQTYSRFLGKCEDPYDMLDKDVRADVKDILKGKGKLVAVAQSGRALSGAPRYVLFVDVKDGVKFYSYTKLNKLYNEFGPFKDLETALSNADCYGLFEEGKNNMNKKLFEEINEEYDPYDDDLGYGPDGMGVYDDEMEDANDYVNGKWDWSDYNGDDGAFMGMDQLDDDEFDGRPVDYIGTPKHWSNKTFKDATEETSKEYFPEDPDDIGLYADSENKVHASADGTVSGGLGGNAIELFGENKNDAKTMFFESILKEGVGYELSTLKDTDSMDFCFYGDKSYTENWTVADIAKNLRKGKILIEDDTGEMNTVIKDERSALETAKYIFIKVYYGMRVKVTMYYDEDGNNCSDSDDWEDYETLLDLCSPSCEE